MKRTFPSAANALTFWKPDQHLTERIKDRAGQMAGSAFMGEKKGRSDGIPLDQAGGEQHALRQGCITADAGSDDPGGSDAHLNSRNVDRCQRGIGVLAHFNIAHANHICQEYEHAGYKAVSIDSKTPAAERKELVDKFKKSEIDIIVNVDIFSEGFDCPDIEFIQLARPTRSLVKYLQQVGRGLRPTENKQNCVILDNVGMYSRFGLPDARRYWNHHFVGHDVVEEPLVADGEVMKTGAIKVEIEPKALTIWEI